MKNWIPEKQEIARTYDAMVVNAFLIDIDQCEDEVRLITLMADMRFFIDNGAYTEPCKEFLEGVLVNLGSQLERGAAH